MGPEEGYIPDDKAHWGQGQYFCRLDSHAYRDWTYWMLNQEVFQKVNQLWGPLEVDLAICHKTVATVSVVLQLETGTPNRESGCIFSRLVNSQRICTPTLVPDIQVSEESPRSTCNSGSNHSTLGSSAMIFNGFHNVNRLSKMSFTSGQSSWGNSKCRPTKHANTTKSGLMAHFWESLYDKRISKEVEDRTTIRFLEERHPQELWLCMERVGAIAYQ